MPLGSALLTSGSASLFVGSLPFGSLMLHAFFAGDTNFASSTSSGTPMSVTAATPTLTWTPPGSPIYTGTVVSPGLFNAHSTVSGTFTYTASLGSSPAVPLTFASVLQAGTYKLAVTITPYNPSYYVPTRVSVMDTVLPATVTVTPANASRRFGAVNPTLSAAVSGALNGDVLSAVGTSTATTLSSVGTYPITYMLNGVNAANYSFPAAATGTLTVTQAAPQVSWNQLAGIVYGTTLSSTELNAVSVAPGSYTYTPSAGTLLYPGVQTLSVSFTSNDKTNYSSSTVTTSLVFDVVPASLTVSVAKSGTTTDALSVSALAGYAGTVQLSCAGLPALSQSSFLPATVSFSGSNSSTSVTLTLQTGVTTAALRQGEGERPGRSLTVIAAVLGIPGLFGIGLFRRKRPGCSLLTRLLLFTFLVSGLGVAGCGGGPAASNTTTAAKTPVGATSFQVIAKDANALSQAAVPSLTVQ